MRVRRTREPADTAVDAVFLALVTALLFCLLAPAALCQDRWRLIPPGQYAWMGGDTAIVAPFPELREAAGLRVADRARLRNFAWTIVRQEQEVVALRKALDAAKVADGSNRELIGDLNEALLLAVAGKTKAERRARRGAMWFGIGVGAGLVSGIVIMR